MFSLSPFQFSCSCFLWKPVGALGLVTSTVELQVESGKTVMACELIRQQVEAGATMFVPGSPR